METFNKIQKIISDELLDENEKVFRLKNIIAEHETKNAIVSPTKKIQTIINDSLLHNAKEKNKIEIESGYATFDELTGGFLPGELVVIGARPAMGKTSLLTNLALNISKNIPVLYCSLEISEDFLSKKFVSLITQVPYQRLIYNKINEQELSLIKEKMNSFESKLFINDVVSNSLGSLKRVWKETIAENKIKVVIVDYIQMINSFNRRQNREMEIAYISRELKALAKEYNVCVLVASQLSRAVETRGGDKRPQLSDLRESGAIEQDADKVIFIHRPEYYAITEDENGNSTSGKMDLIVAKNRSGNVGTALLHFNPTTCSISEYREKSMIAFDFTNRKTEITWDNPQHDIDEHPF